ncbi:hypothetical protein [uncultured Kordia sp.]|uniref:hypothetical protein n=1 Tax=uncultured Kordia sp. TaxID=507699 RepID=UPI00260A5E41|nr:hypothetical protein [uncultured Kordia sp.]
MIHITDVLNKKLSKIGSTLSFDKESNEIGEQIAYENIEDRSIEIIRFPKEKEIWVSFRYQSVSLPSLNSSDIEKITKIVFEFLELKISLNDFFGNYIKSPIDISNLANDKEILLELSWFNFLQPSQYDHLGPKEHIILREFAKAIESIAKAKKLNPYWSHTRLCFTLDRKFKTGNFPSIWVSSQEKEIPIFTIVDYDGVKLSSGTAEEIKDIFKEII